MNTPIKQQIQGWLILAHAILHPLMIGTEQLIIQLNLQTIQDSMHEYWDQPVQENKTGYNDHTAHGRKST